MVHRLPGEKPAVFLEPFVPCVVFDKQKNGADAFIRLRFSILRMPPTCLLYTSPIGVCPLYYGYSESGNILLRASLRAVGLDRGSPLPTRPLLRGRPVCPYQDIAEGSDVSYDTLSDIFRNMLDKLVGIAKRLDADAPAGFLRRGGLDSSLVCVVSARLLKSRSARSPSARRATPST